MRALTRLAIGTAAVSTLLATSLDVARAANAPQVVHLAKAERAPRIDGTLRDPAWQHAPAFTDFKTLHPTFGKEASEHTEAYLTYDHESIYVGIRSLDSEPGRIRSRATQRDKEGPDDWVAFCLDSRNDGLSAVFFMVTPGGVQVDGTLDPNGSRNTSFDTKWASATARTDNGWTAEMAIPFARLPFRRNERVVMGFKIARFISRISEEVNFPAIGPETVPHLSGFQKIEFSGIGRSRLSIDRPLIDIHRISKDRLRLRTVADIDTYEGRVREWGDASVFDYLVFPARELQPAAKPFQFARRAQEGEVAKIFDGLECYPGKKIGDLDALLSQTETSSFIVIQNDAILYEKYFNGYQRDSIVTSFSVAKSFASTLVGIAIDEGHIGGVSDPITKYIPELGKRDERFTRITIRDLLTMASGIRYKEDEPSYDNRITYLEPDLRKAAIEKTVIIEPPGKHWVYNNYHPLLIGMILERVTGRSVTSYLQEKLWAPMGMQYGGSWSVNSDNNGLEKMESGINAHSLDFAKLGRLFLNNGRWEGKQVVSESWVQQATQPEEKPSGFYEDNPLFYYKYFWWGIRRPGGKSDFFGLGNKGQYVYVCPQKNLIIVRNGIEFGLPAQRWARLFYAYASATR